MPEARLSQPPLVAAPRPELTAAIAGLALGGAERIVLDWAARAGQTWPVHLIVLRDHRQEWPLPAGVRTTRLHGANVLEQLAEIGGAIARGPAPVCVAHLLTAAERRALAGAGAFVIPVLHNAPDGWLEDAAALDGSRLVVAVSEATAREARARLPRTTVSVIRHVPRTSRIRGGERRALRAAWRIPEDAMVIGMAGGVKPQKDYPFAIRLLRALNERRAVYLVILGGPTGRNGRDAWTAVLDEVREQGMRQRVAMPGFVADAAGALPAIDLLLNTSRYEGLSIATAEALVNGVSAVVSDVGGQSELASERLTLVPKEAPLQAWCDAVWRAVDADGPAATKATRSMPAWSGFPSHRLWTLAHLARPFRREDRVLFVTANLNAGGAQRSLVNLATGLRPGSFEIAVTGDSTADYFLQRLDARGAVVRRTASSRDAFDHADALVERICADRFGTVCFWNVDAKIKLLVAKALACTDAALVDVSPGPDAFREMDAAAAFGRFAGFGGADYYARLDRFVVKYQGGGIEAAAGKITVIPNGVAAPSRAKDRYDLAGAPKVVVHGRIAPSKFLVEIVEAMAIVRQTLPAAELHIHGAIEPRHREYAETVRQAAGAEIDRRVFFHGAGGDTPDVLPAYDACVVLGAGQGCPNAVLEALAAGLPCVANDDGGTREQIVHEQTGLLVADRSPATLAAAIGRVLGDRALAARLGGAGRQHVLTHFSMTSMIERYEALWQPLAQAREESEMTA